MAANLANLGSFLSKQENIYGFDIQRTTLKDSILVSIKDTTQNYPTTEFIYSLIKNVKYYISGQGAKETNFPMLNIARNADSSYVTMVAVAANKQVPGSGRIVLKRLIQIPDKTLTTEVKGGVKSVDNALKAIEKYMTDYQLAAPVIPFQVLVTDRSQVKDTTKWITRIYYPII
jgi:hypothetical protein